MNLDNTKLRDIHHWDLEIVSGFAVEPGAIKLGYMKHPTVPICLNQCILYYRYPTDQQIDLSKGRIQGQEMQSSFVVDSILVSLDTGGLFEVYDFF